MTESSILFTKEGPVATITLNRPEQLNTITAQMEDELHAALDEADEDRDIRAIILTGAGRAFCTGFDIRGSGDGGPGTARREDPKDRPIEDYIADWYRNDALKIDKLLHLWRLTKPVIAAVNGYAMGGGFWYQLACDLTVASERAVFAQPEVRHVSNTTYLFVALVGWKNANRYALTGDHFDAQEAYRMGIVNEVVPHDELMERAHALARRIALVPEASVRLNKAIAMMGLEASGLRAGMLLNGALSTLAHCSHGPDRERLFEAQRQGGMRAFLEARDGPFRPEPFGPKSASGSPPASP